MKRKELCTLSSTRLSHEDASTLFHLTLEVCGPLKAGIGEMGNASLLNFETHAIPFIDQTNRLRESPLSPLIVIARKLNDELMAEIKRTVVFELKSRNVTHKDAAVALDYFYKPYWDLSKRALGAQIKDTTEMIGKYEADNAMIANAVALGIDTIMGELKVSNIDLSTLYLERNEEIGGRAASGTDLRPPANEMYVQFCNVMEQLMNLMPNESIITLFNSMNALRIKAHALLPKSKDKPDVDDTKE